MRFLSLLFFCWVFTSCIQFRLSEEEFVSTFENQEVLPKQADLIIDSSNIHYVYTDQGRDELLVFVHGSPGSWSAFIDFFKNDSLLSRFDMVSIDRPGFGDSDYGMPEKSLEKQAYFLSRVIELFPQKNKIMIGHSLGGPVIARIAMDYPNLTQGMVMVAPSIDPDMEKYEWYRTWIGTKIVGSITPKDFWVSNEEILPLKEELQLMLPLWGKIIIPTVLVQGTKDVMVPKENAEFARKMFRTEILTINYLEGVNHFIPWSNPEEIVRGIYLVSR